MTNFQLKANRPVEAWLTPERAVVVVPILAGLVLAGTLAAAVIRPQLSRLHERRSVVEVMEQKSEALPGLEQALAQRRVDQAEVMAQQQRLLGLIAGTSELETFLAELNDLADERDWGLRAVPVDSGHVQVIHKEDELFTWWRSVDPAHSLLNFADEHRLQGIRVRERVEIDGRCEGLHFNLYALF